METEAHTPPLTELEREHLMVLAQVGANDIKTALNMQTFQGCLPSRFNALVKRGLAERVDAHDENGPTVYWFLTPAGRAAAGVAEPLTPLEEEMRAALRPFVAYGTILLGLRTRDDSVLIELWDHKITVGDFRRLAALSARIAMAKAQARAGAEDRT